MEPTGTVVVRALSSSETTCVEEAVALGDRHRGTLGFMPRQGFFDRAAVGTLLAAVVGEEVVGYALFDLPGFRIRLIHLCVASDHAGRGVARLLLDEIRARHGDRRGVALKCRRDFPAAAAWPKLGFAPRGDVSGRSFAGHPLTVWWYDYGHPDLFTPDPTLGALLVAVDTNVVSDLHSGSARVRSEESVGLLAPWLAGDIELVVTTHLLGELNGREDAADRARLLAGVQAYRVLSADMASVSDVADGLLAELDPGDLERDESLGRDARLIASAALGGADLFVTRDQGALDKLGPIAERRLGFRVIPPSDVLVHLDQVRDASSYSPTSLLETGYSLASLAAGQEHAVEHLINTGQGETRSAYRAAVRSAAMAAGSGRGRRVLRTPSGDVIALVATRVRDRALVANLIRVDARSTLASTVSLQLLFLLRREARDDGLDVVEVSDQAPSECVVRVLPEDGFRQGSDGSWQALVVDRCGSWREVKASASAVFEPNAEAPAVHDVPDARVAALLEHEWWPAKIIDSALPSYLVPIKPPFASMLFGNDRSLFERDPVLGLSREHVYYRAPRPQPMHAPGRILWYASGSVRAVVGCSQLTEVILDDPAALHRRFRHLGVWAAKDVAAVSRSGLACALRFRDTELFSSQVSLARLRALSPDGKLDPLPSPRRIEPSAFAAVFLEGGRR